MSGGFDAEGLADRIAGGEALALARGISHVENERVGFEALLERLDGRTGRARRIGITGPPGAGKSTLTAALTRHYLDRSLTVGIVAVDPTSPFTGGALLGDRIRMGELSTEPGVFIRSMASRGSLGGLATATREAADLMDAAGYDRVILETLGVGQTELDIAVSADTTAVVLVPESGDGVQAMKAGLMEVADLFVVNKSDRPGADRLEKEIAIIMSIRFANRPAEWRLPIVQTVASEARGIEEFADRLDQHFAWLASSGQLESHRRAARLRRAHDALLRRSRRDAERIWRAAPPEMLDSGASPYAIARRLYEEFNET
ncbi:methylmalonyl Co-A mutase-associated GTPase MeaB [Candidatus Palauibacter sp.]|uniref:methylmalonyl Co-A mutase-associated GTPase MeaB n=1 Tax=Candidatus Palauibacter sp. TaxID=3101350 RepID=UPI003B016172